MLCELWIKARPKRVEITCNWRKLHNEAFLICILPIILIRMMKTRKMRWYGHVLCIRKTINKNRILVGKPDVIYSLKFVLL
jgi:hypothetical protein